MHKDLDKLVPLFISLLCSLLASFCYSLSCKTPCCVSGETVFWENGNAYHKHEGADIFTEMLLKSVFFRKSLSLSKPSTWFPCCNTVPVNLTLLKRPEFSLLQISRSSPTVLNRPNNIYLTKRLTLRKKNTQNESIHNNLLSLYILACIKSDIY